jgi:hypothetical protein
VGVGGVGAGGLPSLLVQYTLPASICFVDGDGLTSCWPAARPTYGRVWAREPGPCKVTLISEGHYYLQVPDAQLFWYMACNPG